MEPDNRIWYAVWNMELKNDPGTIVGDFCFKRIGKDGVVEIGYGLKEPYRYHGYMSETVKAITEWVLLQDNVRIVEAETDVNNIASQQVLMRAGFIKNGKIGEEGSRFVYGGEKGMSDKIYPRTSDKQTVYLKNVVTNANIEKECGYSHSFSVSYLQQIFRLAPENASEINDINGFGVVDIALALLEKLDLS